METSLKTCFKCGAAKPLDDFYRHPQMGDGHLNKCKECTKLDMRIHGQKPEARKRRKEYDRARQQTKERREKKQLYQKARRERDPVRAKAWRAVGNAVHSGKLIRKPCEVCGNTQSQAHHPDYSQPLAVGWLCFEHHRALHGQRVREEEATYAS